MNVSKTITKHITKHIKNLILSSLFLGFASAAPSLSISPAYSPNTLQTIPSSGTFYNLSVLPKNLTHSSQSIPTTLERLTSRTLEQAVEANLDGGKVRLISQNNSSYTLNSPMGNAMIGIRGLAQLEQGGQIRQVAFEMIVDSFYNTVVDFDARIDGKPLE
jgi:hypothetical protein